MSGLKPMLFFYVDFAFCFDLPVTEEQTNRGPESSAISGTMSYARTQKDNKNQKFLLCLASAFLNAHESTKSRLQNRDLRNFVGCKAAVVRAAPVISFPDSQGFRLYQRRIPAVFKRIGDFCLLTLTLCGRLELLPLDKGAQL